jgi:hypothetical protein
MWEAVLAGSGHPVTHAFLRRPMLPGSRGFEKVTAAIAVRLALHGQAAPQTLFVLVPSASAATDRYITAGLLIGNLAHAGQVVGLPPEERRSILKGDLLFVTPSVTASKAELDGLTLIGGRSIGDFWNVQALSRYAPQRGGGPRAFVANPGWVVATFPAKGFAAAVVDASHPRALSRLNEILTGPIAKCPIRIIVAPPLQRNLLQAYGFPETAKVWFWDPQSQREADAMTSAPVAAQLKPSVRTVWVCDEDEEGAEVLSGVHDRLVDALGKAGGKPLPGLLLAWGIYHRLRQLTVPLVQLEQASASAWGGSLKRRIEALSGIEGHGNPVWETTWPALRAGVEEAYRVFSLRSEPAKFWVLASRVEEWLRNPKHEVYRIAVSTHHEAGLLTSLLEEIVDRFREARATGLIEVTSINEEEKLIAVQHVAHTLLPGARSARTRYLDVYPHAEVEQLAYPFEVDLERATQQRLYQFAEQLQDDHSRVRLLESLGLRSSVAALPSAESVSSAPSLRCLLGSGREIRLVTQSRVVPAIDVEELAGIGAVGLPGQGRYGIDHLLSGADLTGPVAVVHYTDGVSMRYPANHRVDVFFGETDSIQRESVRDLRPGWRVISFVDGPYEGLFRRLAEAVHEHLGQRERIALELWRQAKTRALQNFKGDRRALYADLARRGLSSDYGTVTTWFREGQDEILAPQQLEDFVLLARASGTYPDEDLMIDTFRCIQQHRGRHRAEGRILRGLLRAIVSGNGYDEALESARKIDANVGDVLAAVELLEVEAVDLSETSGP